MAVTIAPRLWIDVIRPEQGSAAFQATASAWVLSLRTVLPWITLASGANRFAAVSSSSWFSAWLHAWTTLPVEGAP